MKKNDIFENNLKFVPHITFLKIFENFYSELDFQNHIENIEKIIFEELKNLKNENINSGKIFLYAVNSEFKEEIQIKI